MTWEEIMRRVLPPVGGLPPRVTDPGAFGAGVEQGRHPPSSIPHKGVDFNYPVGQAGINKSYPMLHSPVAGVVTNAGEGNVGRIAIRDANGFTHEILHTHTQSVRKGDLVGVGTAIGTMGNRGVKHANVESGDYHVHYQLKDRSGNVVNPTEYWNNLGPGKDDPGQPAFLDQSKRALDEKSPLNGAPPPDRPSQPFFNPFNQTASAPAAAALPSTPNAPNSFADRYPAWGTVPRPNAPAGSDDPASFADRFGNWASVLSGAPGNAGARGTPASRAPSGQRSEIPDSATPASVTTGDDSTQVGIPFRRLVNRSSPFSTSASPLAPSPSQPSPGIFFGQPMWNYPLPPSIFHAKLQSSPDDDELFPRWMRFIDA